MFNLVMERIKLYFASVVVIYLVLTIWFLGYMHNCVVLLFPMIVWSVIASSFIDIKLHERKCFKNCYFVSNSLFAKILSSRFFIVIIYMIITVLMTYSALYGVLGYSVSMWIYIFFHVIVSILVYKAFIILFQNTIKDSYKKIFAREWTINVMAFVFIVAFIVISMNEYEPIYLRHGLKETMDAASLSIFSQCDYANVALKLQREVESIYWWAMHQSSENIENTTAKYMMWGVFLLMNALAILGVNRFILQVIYWLDKKII